MSDINVLRNYLKKKKKTKKTGNYIQHPIDIGVCGVNLGLPTSRIYWLNHFSRAEGVPKATENTRKFVVFSVLC